MSRRENHFFELGEAPNDLRSKHGACHLKRVGIVAVLGIGIALLSVYIHINRLAFEVAVGLVLLAALGLTRLVIGLRKY